MRAHGCSSVVSALLRSRMNEVCGSTKWFIWTKVWGNSSATSVTTDEKERSVSTLTWQFILTTSHTSAPRMVATLEPKFWEEFPVIALIFTNWQSHFAAASGTVVTMENTTRTWTDMCVWFMKTVKKPKYVPIVRNHFTDLTNCGPKWQSILKKGRTNAIFSSATTAALQQHLFADTW